MHTTLSHKSQLKLFDPLFMKSSQSAKFKHGTRLGTQEKLKESWEVELSLAADEFSKFYTYAPAI